MGKTIHFEADTRLGRGQANPVKIIVDFDKPTRVRGIHATFHAAEKTVANYTVTTTDAKGKTRVETRTAVEYSNIVKETFLLFGNARKGFFSRLLDSLLTWIGRGQHEVVQPGHREFEVNLKIPDQAPASFEGGKCQVFYVLTVQVDLPIKIDWSGKHQFAVGPMGTALDDINPVHVVFPDESGRSFWDRKMGKDVTLNLALDRDTLSAGEKALAMLTVETPEPLKIDEISVFLVGVESTTAQGHKDSHGHNHPLDDIDSPNVITNESVHEFDVQIPDIEGPYTQTGQNFDVRWFVKVRLKVPWAKDPIIRLPIKLLPKRLG